MVSSTYYQVSRYHQYQDISSIVPLFFPFYFFPLLATHHAVTTLKPTNRKFPDARLGICQQCVAGFGICHQVSPHHQSQIPWAADRPLTISSSKGTWYNIERWRRNRSYMKRFEKICTNIHHVRHMKVHERSWKPLVYITWHYFLPEISSLCITNHGVQLQYEAQVLFVIEAAADGLYSFPSFLSKRLGSHQLIHPPNPLRPQLPFEFSPRCPATLLLMRRSEHPATAHGLTGWWVWTAGWWEHPSNRRWFMTRSDDKIR